jgi:hypothetical protein
LEPESPTLSPEHSLEAYPTLRRRVSIWVPWISREDVFQTSLDAPEINVACKHRFPACVGTRGSNRAESQRSLRGSHAFCAAFRNFDSSSDFIRLVFQVRCVAFGNPDLASIKGEDGSAGGEAGSVAHIPALELAIVQRQHVVLCRFDPEKVLQVTELLQVLYRQILGFAEVLVHVVELPFVVIHVDGFARFPVLSLEGNWSIVRTNMVALRACLTRLFDLLGANAASVAQTLPLVVA